MMTYFQVEAFLALIIIEVLMLWARLMGRRLENISKATHKLRGQGSCKFSNIKKYQSFILIHIQNVHTKY